MSWVALPPGTEILAQSPGDLRGGTLRRGIFRLQDPGAVELAVSRVVHGHDVPAVDEPEVSARHGEFGGQRGVREVDDADQLAGLGIERVSPLALVSLVVGDRVVDDAYSAPDTARSPRPEG